MNVIQKLYNRLDPCSPRNITYEKALRSRRWTVLHGKIEPSSGDRLRNVYFANPNITRIVIKDAIDVTVENCCLPMLRDDFVALKEKLGEQ